MLTTNLFSCLSENVFFFTFIFEGCFHKIMNFFFFFYCFQHFEDVFPLSSGLHRIRWEFSSDFLFPLCVTLLWLCSRVILYLWFVGIWPWCTLVYFSSHLSYVAFPWPRIFNCISFTLFGRLSSIVFPINFSALFSLVSFWDFN